MASDQITIRLGLPEFKVTHHQELASHHLVYLEKATAFGLCPNCRCKTEQDIRDDHQRQVQDLPILGKPVWLLIRQRRFLCDNCGARFRESFESVDILQRQTQRLQQAIVVQARGTSILKASQDLQVGYRVVERIYLKTAEERNPNLRLPKFIGIDEYAAKKGHHYHTIVVNLKQHIVFDVSVGHKCSSLKEILMNHPARSRIKAAVIDMWQPYRSALQECCPKAKIIVDRFHFQQHLSKALDEVRKRIQRQCPEEEKQRLKNNLRLILTHRDNLQAEDRKKRNQLLQAHPELKKAVTFVEYIGRWYDNQRDVQKARTLLNAWIHRVRKANVPELEAILCTIKRWKKEILNYFLFYLTNGPVEGINTKVKLIIRIGYGIPNFSHLRARVLMECGRGP